LRAIWAAYADGSLRSHVAIVDALQMHRGLIFGKRASDAGISEMEHRQALKILEQQDALLPKSNVLRCRIRYFRAVQQIVCKLYFV
jgi:predicted transcriptional regulator